MTEFSSADILSAITDPNGESNVYEDINSLDLNLDDDDYDKILLSIVGDGLLSQDNYRQIYDLIPPGAVYQYTVESEKDQTVDPREFKYLSTPNADQLTIERAVNAMIANAIGKEIVFEFTEEQQSNVNSGYDIYSTYDAIQPDFTITINTGVDRPVGFFEKQFPDDEHLKYDFNIDDQSLFCIISALFKQEPKLYYQCGKTPLLPGEEKEFYLEILNKCDIATHNEFAITSENVYKFYRKFGEVYNLNVNITYYSFVENKEYLLQSLIGRNHIKLNFDENKELLRLAIAKLGNHMFNINKTTSSRNDALKYLSKIARDYDSLKDRKIVNTFKEVQKLSRKHSKDYKQYQQKLINNPHLLLVGADVNKCAVLDKTESDDLGTDKEKIIHVPFIFDFETVLNEKNEHYIYSYVIKKVDTEVTPPTTHNETNTPSPSVVGGATPQETYFDYFPFDDKTKDKYNPLVRLFNFVIKNTKEYERAILFAHNGAKFDNLLVLKMATTTYGMHSFKEITAGPNNDIMLSLDITYSYKTERHSTKFHKKVISFRDSYKLLDCKASDIPKNYGTKAFKLPYCYNIYNEMFKITLDDKLSQNQKKYQMLKFFDRKERERFTLKNGKKDEEMTRIYDEIYNGKYTDIDEKIRSELEECINQTKKKKIYYHPELYCKIYNKYDVLVVEEGLLKMQEYIRSLHSVESIISLIESADVKLEKEKLESLKAKVRKLKVLDTVKDLNLFEYRSLASLVFDIAKKSGIFDNIYKLTGPLKKFVQLSVVGGRVMKNPKSENNNYKSKNYDFFLDQIGKEANPELDKEIMQKALEDSIIDNDAVSLYPSAISLCKMPAGKPKIYNLTEEESEKVIDVLPKLLRKGRSFLCIDVETRKDLEYPILSEKDENGIRRFRNGKFSKIVVGDIALSDAIKYQDVKVTRIYSLVRFEETCDKFAKFITTLFTLRLIFKAIKLPCQNTIKLMMNSSYGRTILKECNYKKVYRRLTTPDDVRLFKGYLSKNYYYLKPEMVMIGNFVKIQKRQLIDKPEGYPHVGSHILEMSKQLMNTMFDKIYGNGFTVYYTDTDSIHVKAGSLAKLGDMLGEDMTKFHSDFGEEGYRGVFCKELGNTNPGIFAIRSVFVMKKCYFDKLFCINNKTNKYELIEHKRVKGISSNFMNEERYEKLLNGDILECDLAEYRDMILRKTKDGMLVNLTSFKRAITKTD